jgi:predicted MPP superfamily phosphohydrolase
MKIGFFLIAFSVLLLTNGYVALRGWQSLALLPVSRTIYLTSVVVLFLAMFVTMLFGHKMPLLLAKALSFVTFTYILVFVYLFLSFLVVDFVGLLNYLFHFIPINIIVFRQWALLVSFAIISIALVLGNFQFNHPQLVTLNISAAKPKQNKSIKIVLVSDLHLGFSIDKARLKGYVDLINAQHPDVVLMAGDITDRSIEPVISQHMNEELKTIKAKLGVYAINGNHEHYAEVVHATEEYLNSSGIHFLRDNSVLVDNSFYIVGRDDRSNLNRKQLTELVNGLDAAKPKIMMDHQPFHLEEAEQNGIDLQVSGHTHNGQFFPGNLIVKRMYEVGYGYLQKGKTHYYVSSGLGLWGPQYRIGTQSEVVLINFSY